jgi:hypothetical protein
MRVLRWESPCPTQTLSALSEVGKVCAIIDKGQEMVSDKVLITAGAIDLGYKAMSISATLAASVACNNYREACENLADGAISQQHAEVRLL